MKLSDIVGAASGLAIYAEIGLVLFLGAFIAVLFQVASRSRAKDWEEARALPLSDSNERVRGRHAVGHTDCSSE
jgi:hypothetical protein